MPTRLFCPLRQTMDLPRCAAATSAFGTLRCARPRRLFLLERDGRSYYCCKPRRTGHCCNSPCDNRPDKSDLSLSATTQASVSQPMDELHLTDSQACPRCKCHCLLPLRISRCRTRQPAQPPPARIYGYAKEARFMGLCPSSRVVRSRAFCVSEHLTGRRGLDP
jgi:hypothetical protein